MAQNSSTVNKPMVQVWIGLSTTLDFTQLICKYIDPFFGPVEEGSNPVGLLEAEFGSRRFNPSDYEVFAKADYPDEKFDHSLFQRLAPFADPAPGLRDAITDETKTMFFVKCDRRPIKTADENILITDVRDVSFHWE
jgi:hypothetical protein